MPGGRQYVPQVDEFDILVKRIFLSKGLTTRTDMHTETQDNRP
jgi:hypothetical protein